MRASLPKPGDLNANDLDDAVVRLRDMIAHRSSSLLLICRESCNHNTPHGDIHVDMPPDLRKLCRRCVDRSRQPVDHIERARTHMHPSP